ncbi:MAG: hypothetical protein R3C39_06380 [Dehalococcoidia bacterium]
MFRVTTRLLLVAAALAALGGAACSDNDATPSATAEATGTATAVADPMPQLTDLGDATFSEESVDGSVVMRWIVDGPSAEDVANGLVDRVGSIPGLTLTATEVTERGSIIAFEGVRSGHYLVTRSTGQGTPVELRVDPENATAEATSEGPGRRPPEGFPAIEVPLFPGATVLEGERSDLGDGLVRFDLTLESERDSVEVLGYYADLFRAAGWTVTAEPGVVEVHGTGRVTTVWVREVADAPSNTTLEVVVRGTEGAP